MSASSSTGASTGSGQGLWVTQNHVFDHNEAFVRTVADREKRFEAMRAAGMALAVKTFEKFSEIETCLETEFPDGVELLGFSMHASQNQLPLSSDSEGTFSKDETGPLLLTMEGIFQRVKRCFMIEGCQTGDGKNSLLKRLVALCPSGVLGIGSQGSEHELAYDPALVEFLRFHDLRTRTDITRIYYKTEKGDVQNIPVKELFLLWDFWKERVAQKDQERLFRLCYKMLGERNNPAVFNRLKEENRDLIEALENDAAAILAEVRAVEVTPAGAKRIWREILQEVEMRKGELGSYAGDTPSTIPQIERTRSTSDVEDHWGGLQVEERAHPWLRVFLNFLACSYLDQHKSLLMLLDNQQAYSKNPACLAIKALTGLTVHGDNRVCIVEMLGHYLPIMKKSFIVARQRGLLNEWFQGISQTRCFNDLIRFIDEFYQENILLSRKEQYEKALLNEDWQKIGQLIQGGFDLTELGEDPPTLYDNALVSKNYFLAYIVAEKHLPDRLPNVLSAIQQISSWSNPIEKQLQALSQYLAKQGKSIEAGQIGAAIPNKETLLQNALITAQRGDFEEAIQLLSDVRPDFFANGKLRAGFQSCVEQIFVLAGNLSEFHVIQQLSPLFSDPSVYQTFLISLCQEVKERGRLNQLLEAWVQSNGSRSRILACLLEIYLAQHDREGFFELERLWTDPNSLPDSENIRCYSVAIPRLAEPQQRLFVEWLLETKTTDFLSTLCTLHPYTQFRWILHMGLANHYLKQKKFREILDLLQAGGFLTKGVFLQDKQEMELILQEIVKEGLKEKNFDAAFQAVFFIETPAVFEQCLTDVVVQSIQEGLFEVFLLLHNHLPTSQFFIQIARICLRENLIDRFLVLDQMDPFSQWSPSEKANTYANLFNSLSYTERKRLCEVWVQRGDMTLIHQTGEKISCSFTQRSFDSMISLAFQNQGLLTQAQEFAKSLPPSRRYPLFNQMFQDLLRKKEYEACYQLLDQIELKEDYLLWLRTEKHHALALVVAARSGPKTQVKEIFDAYAQDQKEIFANQLSEWLTAGAHFSLALAVAYLEKNGPYPSLGYGALNTCLVNMARSGHLKSACAEAKALFASEPALKHNYSLLDACRTIIEEAIASNQFSIAIQAYQCLNAFDQETRSKQICDALFARDQIQGAIDRLNKAGISFDTSKDHFFYSIFWSQSQAGYDDGRRWFRGMDCIPTQPLPTFASFEKGLVGCKKLYLHYDLLRKLILASEKPSQMLCNRYLEQYRLLTVWLAMLPKTTSPKKMETIAALKKNIQNMHERLIAIQKPAF